MAVQGGKYMKFVRYVLPGTKGIYPLGCESPLFAPEEQIVMSGVANRAKWFTPPAVTVYPKNVYNLGYYEQLPQP